MPTNRLLARLKRLYSCEESFEMSEEEFYENVESLIEFTDTLQWKTEYENMKKVLADREHIPRKI